MQVLCVCAPNGDNISKSRHTNERKGNLVHPPYTPFHPTHNLPSFVCGWPWVKWVTPIINLVYSVTPHYTAILSASPRVLSGGDLAGSMLGWLTERPTLWLAGGRWLTVWERRGELADFKHSIWPFQPFSGWLEPLCVPGYLEMEHAHTPHIHKHTQRHTGTLESILFLARSCPLEKAALYFNIPPK